VKNFCNSVTNYVPLAGIAEENDGCNNAKILILNTGCNELAATPTLIAALALL
jgi:hypothetical protein